MGLSGCVYMYIYTHMMSPDNLNWFYAVPSIMRGARALCNISFRTGYLERFRTVVKFVGWCPKKSNDQQRVYAYFVCVLPSRTYLPAGVSSQV